MNTTSPGAPAGGSGVEQEKPFAVPSTLYTLRSDGPQVGTGTVIRIVLIVLGIALAAYLVYRVLPVLLILMIAVMVATAIEPVVNKLRRGPFNRGQGILIVYTGIFAVLAIIGWLIIPVFINQVGELVGHRTEYSKGIQDWAAQIQDPFLRSQAQNMAGAAKALFGDAGGPVTSPSEQVATVSSVALNLAEGVLSVIVIFVIAFYWMTERTHAKRWLVSLLPADRGNRVRRVWDEIEVKVGGWVRGQLTLMGLVGLISAIGYFLIGVHYWPALALFIALAEAIPMVGPYVGTAPAVLIALTQGPNDGLPALLNMSDLTGVTRALLVVVFAVLLQTVEGNVLVPRIMRNSVGISALTVIVSLLLGAALAGLPGALLAVPLAGVIQVVVMDLQTAALARADREQRLAAEESQREAAEQMIPPHAPAVPPGAEPPTLIVAGPAGAKPSGPRP